MNCACHDLPAYWQKDRRLKAGGWWECSVKRAAHNAARFTDEARRARITQAQRDRYDNDWQYRIRKRLVDDARKRALTLKRRKERLGYQEPKA